MTPLSSRLVTSPIGPLRLVATTDALVAVALPTQPGLHAAAAGTRGHHDVLDAAARELAEYFAGTRRQFGIPLAPAGTDFQRSVWRALTAIPFGERRTYGDVARAIGRPRAVRAVGAANGKNPLSIVVPCHRVVGASGALTGYAGGLEVKGWLLAHEGEVLGKAAPRDERAAISAP